MSWFDLQTQPAQMIAPGMGSTGAFGGSWVNPANAPYTPGQPGSFQPGAPNDPAVAQPNLAGNGGTMADLGTDNLLSPWTQQFAPPDSKQIENDPGFQFDFGQGQRAVQSGAAAKGTLLTGGTLKALDTFGTGLAHTYGRDYYDRAMQQYLLSKQNFQENQDRPFTKLSSLAQLGKPSTAV